MLKFLKLFTLMTILSIGVVSYGQDETPITFETPLDIQASLELASETPVILRETGGRYLNGGAVIFHEGEFHMFSNFFNSWPGATYSYYHTSPDAQDWTRVQEEPIFTVRDVPLEGTGALMLDGFVEDGLWILYYHTFTSNRSQGYIGRVTAPDPLGPWTFDEEPVFAPGSAGEWDDLQVMRVNVLKTDDDTYAMYYAGVNTDGSQIGMATSDDGITWTKYDDPSTTDAPYAESDPIMQPTLEWEGNWLGRPEVVKTADGYVMLYEGTGGSQTGIAISQDGVNFARYDQNPILTSDNMVENYSFFQGAFFHNDDTYYYLIEAGNGRIGTDIYLYTIDGSLLGAEETSSAPSPFIYSSHYGGISAGEWDVANAELFFEQYPDLETQILRTDYYRSPVNRIIHQQVTADNPPDVFSASLNGNLRDYARQGLIADISDLWEEQNWDEVFPASIKAMSSVDGRQYFVPQAIQWNGIFYHIDVMESAGVTPPTTWDELLAVCETLHDAGITPFVVPANPTWTPPMGFWFTHINLRLNGADFHEQLMNGDVAYTDERVENVFTHWSQLFEHNCFAENATRVTYNQMVGTWDAGEAAMTAHGEWLYEFISEDAKDNTGFIRFPIIDEAIPLGELVPMYGSFMMADTAYPDVARDFLIQMAGIDSQTSNMLDISRLPSNLDVNIEGMRPIYADGLQLILDAESLTPLIGSNTHPNIATALYDGIVNFWRNPADIDRILASVEASRQAVYGEVTLDVSLDFQQATTDPIIARDSQLSNRLEAGAIIFHDEQYHMFINRFDRFPDGVNITYASSPDGITWSEDTENILLTTDSVPFADVAVTATSVLVEDDGTWVLYFHTWQTRSLINGAGVIGRATASSPTGVWIVDPEPVLVMSDDADAWDGGQVSIADVIRTEDGYRMYYTGASEAGLMQIGLATSTDGINWVKYDNPETVDTPYAESDPVLANGATGEWDALAAYTPRVAQVDNGWIMFYKDIGTRTERPQVGLATSIDGIHWVKADNSPIMGSDIIENGTWFGLMTLIEVDNQFYLYTEHYTDSRSITDIYLLTADVPN